MSNKRGPIALEHPKYGLIILADKEDIEVDEESHPASYWLGLETGYPKDDAGLFGDKYSREVFKRAVRLFLGEELPTEPVACSPKNKTELWGEIFLSMAVHGNDANLNHINIRKVKDLSRLFAHSTFNGDISAWDVRIVTNMYEMFFCAEFNGDISAWKVNRVTDMFRMFCGSKFAGDISKWRPKAVTDTAMMFYGACGFRCDLSKWVIDENQTRNDHMFAQCRIPHKHKPKIIERIEDNE